MSNRKRTAAAPVGTNRTRVALYLRVSTDRQRQHDLSIPDQRAQILAWCDANGHQSVAEFVEGGATGTDDKRPVFQQMIERACDGDNAFDVIAVHSYSRFFRDAFGQEFYLRKLAKQGVKLVSITQPLGDDDDPAQAMMRKVIALFDEYQSKENAKHVLRNMKLNAAQGFWNGSPVPLGYVLVEVEKRGTKIKKTLAIDPVDAETVQLIYKLYLHGDGTSGRARRQRGRQMAQQPRLSHAQGQNVWRRHHLQDPHQHDLHGRLEIQPDVVPHRKMEARRRGCRRQSVPAIIEPHLFEQVQRQLHARSPKVAAPRVTTGPILLTGLAVCATCSGGMTLRTGTSKTGAVHRYYTCSTVRRKGKTVCKGRSIPMAKLDGLVTTH